MLDFSNYSTKSKCYDNSSKLVIWKMKDETGGVGIEEYIGLKEKMYCWVINAWDIQWIEFKVKTIEEKNMKSTRFHCLVLMTKYIFKTLDMID